MLGIGPSKALICKHLAKKFMELIGPVAAQKKLDAMQAKGFQVRAPSYLGGGTVACCRGGEGRGRGGGGGERDVYSSSARAWERD